MIKRKQLMPVEEIGTLPTECTNLHNEDQQRQCTDIFCIFLSVFLFIVMVVLASVLFSYSNFLKANFPADSEGNVCGVDKENYPYLYFVSPPNIERRVCVQQCPKQGDESLKCKATFNIGCRFTNDVGYEVVYTETTATHTRSGFFCFPTDQKLTKEMLQNSNLEERQLLYKSLDTIILCFLVALGFSILYLICVQCFPKFMSYFAVIVGSLIILACAICILNYSRSEHTFRIVIACLLILVFLIILITYCKNQRNLKIHGIFLSYAAKFIKERPITILYIPLFLIFLVGYIVIVVLQFTSFWTAGELKFDAKDSLFHKPLGVGPIVLSVLLGIQTIWGLAFLKMAFNFCISGEAVLWYYNKKQSFCYPLKLMICKHFGSVIGGSFIIAFFTFFDFIFDFFKPSDSSDENSCYPKCYNFFCSHSIFDLVRTDALAYINLTGNPYCNSARYCEYLCKRSTILDNSQSSGRIYRLCAHFLICGIMIIFALYVKGVISTYAIIIIVINTIFISTLFISLHSDASEAISIIFLVDEELTKRKNKDYGSEIYGNKKISYDHLSGMGLRSQIVEEVKKQRLDQVYGANEKSKSQTA